MSMDRINRLDPSLLAVCGGALCASFALFPPNFNILSFLLIYFAALPLYFVGFCWGFGRLILAVLVALGIFTIGAGLQSGLVFLLTTLLPALLIVYRIEKGDPAGYVVSWVTGLTILTFLGIFIVLSAQSINVLDLLHAWFSFFKEEEAFKHLSGQIIPLIPGLSSITWIMMCLVNAALAARLAIRTQLSRRPYPLPTDTKLYENWDILLAFSFILMLTGVPFLAFVGKNMALMTYVPIFLVGLTAVYAWLEQFENPKLWITMIAIMSIFLVWLGIIIVIFGVLEPTLHLRQRWTPNKS
ncbi:MAG: hypothetical protein K2Y18_09675 [Alphaproteobacteria bacterium]|jgi:hypothetical protein|nr:hypothetical protein [Alphaproteobacteria bacterium]